VLFFMLRSLLQLRVSPPPLQVGSRWSARPLADRQTLLSSFPHRDKVSPLRADISTPLIFSLTLAQRLLGGRFCLPPIPFLDDLSPMLS